LSSSAFTPEYALPVVPVQAVVEARNDGSKLVLPKNSSLMALPVGFHFFESTPASDVIAL